MAITLRNLDQIRVQLDSYKNQNNIATDSKAIIGMIQEFYVWKDKADKYYSEIEELEETLDDYQSERELLSSALKPFLK